VKQATFIEKHRREWDALEAWLGVAPKAKSKASAPDTGIAVPTKPVKKDKRLDGAAFPHAYRRLCQQLALARIRAYSPQLVARLQMLVQAGHQRLYRTRRPEWRIAQRFVAADFPRRVRRDWRYVLASALLLYVPMLVMMALVRYKPELIYSLYPASTVSSFESMYDPSQHTQSIGRTTQSDMAAFGFYIMHNVSIGFQTMAGGLFAGIGAAFALVVNGLMIGAVAGYLTSVGFGATFWSFVVGHSAWELSAIVISGAAGLKLGAKLVAPGRASRANALVTAGREAAPLILGAFLMLVVAAFIEAYWSSIVWLPPAVKYTAGACMWAVVLTWLGTGGRRATR
jgi:uncharacterized membrane protein SpoIIM required for sporulation